MFLNLCFGSQKGWKTYWVEIKDSFLEISTEYQKPPFIAFHLGTLKVRPTKNFPEKPDVLEFYDEEGFSKASFFVFTYDPFDILQFFNDVSNTFKSWRERVSSERRRLQFNGEIKQSGFLSRPYKWTVSETSVTIPKGGKDEVVPFTREEIGFFTPSIKSGKIGVFTYTSKNSQETEYKCTDLAQMKELLDAIYTNEYIALFVEQQ